MRINRRAFLFGVGAVVGCAGRARRGVRVEEIGFSYDDYLYRTPIKFGGTALDRVTLLNVGCTVSDASGKTAKGFGSMPMGNIWAYPSAELSYETTLNAMKGLAGQINKITGDYSEFGHPVDINVALEPEYLKAAGQIPKLATLVTASPFDAAIHDAYGKLYGVSCYQTYGPEHMPHDLSHYLGPEFAGEYLEQYVLKNAEG